MESVARILQEFLNQMIDDPEQAALDLQVLPQEFRELGQSLLGFSQRLGEFATLAKAIAKGNLNVELPPPGNEMAAPLKALHATLKHLTWQTQQVAKGDYRQRVDFMGDFSLAFNSMVEQLEQQRLTLLEQISAVMQRKDLYKTLVGQIEQRIMVADERTAEVLFVSREMKGVPVGENCGADLLEWLRLQIEAGQGLRETRISELALLCNGVVQHYSVSIHPLRWGQHDAFAFVFTDISAEQEQLQRLQNLANIDTLTQLYNRHYGLEALEHWLADRRSFVLCYTDVDELKAVNDRYGHSEGDRYLICVASVLRELFPEAIICRVGGDEFMLLVENGETDSVKERLHGACNRLQDGSVPYGRGISYGFISVGADNRLSAVDLVNAADKQMYGYKNTYKYRH